MVAVSTLGIPSLLMHALITIVERDVPLEALNLQTDMPCVLLRCPAAQ